MRAAQVRNSNVISNNTIDAHGFIDAAQWEQVKRGTNTAIENWIKNQLNGTSVTVVLIGSQTVSPGGAVRPWVKYEIDRSLDRGNGLLGVYINKCNDPRNGTDIRGVNPFDALSFGGTKTKLSTKYRTYDWVDNNGYNNLGSWIEQAARDAGK